MSTETTLAASVAAADATISVVDGNPNEVIEFPETPFYVQIDAETMLVQRSDPTATTWAVLRDTANQVVLVGSDFFDDRETVAHEGGWGPSWRHGDPDESDVDVIGGVGRNTYMVAGLTFQPIYVLPDKLLNGQARIKFQQSVMPEGGDMTFSINLRDLGGSSNTRYRGRLSISTAGVITTRLQKVVGGTVTSLGSNVVAAPTFNATDWFVVAVQASGVSPTNLAMKCWREDDGEPSSWDNTTTDSETTLQAAGDPGIRHDLNASHVTFPTTLLVDDWKVSSVPIGQAHSSGAVVKLVETIAEGVVEPTHTFGFGPPTVNAPTASTHVDLTNNRLYVRVGAVWRYAALT